jgi:hypothetical protein
MLAVPSAEGGKNEKLRVRIDRAQPVGGLGPIARSPLQGRQGQIREMPDQAGEAEDVSEREGPLRQV